MKFDWYQTTIEADSRDVVLTLAKLGHELRPADSLARKYRYSQGWEVHHNMRGIVAHVFTGGNGDKPHAYASSEATADFVSLVRQEWPDRHLVTRMDAAEDFYEKDCYDRLRPVARRIAKRHRLSFPKYEDDLNPEAGRTQYLGSPSSDYRARLYEKGWEQANKFLAFFPALTDRSVNMVRVSQLIVNEVTGEQIRPQDWTRLELQVRPQQEAGRRLAAGVSAEQAWSFSKWTRELAHEAMALDLERICIRTKKYSKDEESIRWLCVQYGSVLKRLKDDLGDYACVGLELGRIISERDSYKG